MSTGNFEFTGATGPLRPDLGGLLQAIEERGAHGGTLLVRLRPGGGWDVRNPVERPTIKVAQADMDMAGRALAIGSDLRREWQLALLFAEHREAASKREDGESA
jgi:hypothetical protein